MYMGREKVSPTLRSALLRPPKMSRPPAARSAACAKFVTSATPLHVFAIGSQIIHLQSRQAACDAAISPTTGLES